MGGRGLTPDRPFLFASLVRGGAVGPRWPRGDPARLAGPSTAVHPAPGKRRPPARRLRAALSGGCGAGSSSRAVAGLLGPEN